MTDQLIELNELAEVRKWYELQQIEKKRKQSEQLKALGKVWGVNIKGREDTKGREDEA